MMTIDNKWEQQFVMVLRSRDVSGAAIGAALAEVESHCAETGESAQEAFGAPQKYAASLDFPASATVPGMPSLSTIVLGASAITGLWLFPDAAGALLRGEDLSITKGWLLAAAGMLTVLIVAGAVVKLAVARPFIAWLTIAAFLLVIVTPMLLWTATAFTTSAWWPTLVAAALLVIGTTGLLVMRDRELDDRLVDPVTGEPEHLPRALGGFARYSALAFPVTAIVLALINWQAGPR